MDVHKEGKSRVDRGDGVKHLDFLVDIISTSSLKTRGTGIGEDLVLGLGETKDPRFDGQIEKMCVYKPLHFRL